MIDLGLLITRFLVRQTRFDASTLSNPPISLIFIGLPEAKAPLDSFAYCRYPHAGIAV